LHAREDGSHRVCIAGLTETEATDEQTLMQVTKLIHTCTLVKSRYRIKIKMNTHVISNLRGQYNQICVYCDFHSEYTYIICV